MLTRLNRLRLSRAQRSLLALTLVSTLGMFFFLDEALRGPDVESYYAYARSLVHDGDILLINEFETLQKATFITPTGYASVLANIGAAFFWLPCFALARLTAEVSNIFFRTAFATDGFDALDRLWLNFGNWLYALVTLVLTYHLSRRFCARRSSFLALAFTCFATPFFYYMSYFVPNTSIPSALVAVLILLSWERARRDGHIAHWLLVGALAGIGLSIATYNGGFLAFPLLTLAGRLRSRWLGALRDGVALVAGVLIGYLPQMLAWQVHYGVVSNPYARQLEPLQPHIVEVLFSTYHGAYFYTPFLTIATLGMVPLWQRDRTLALGALFVFAVHAYATGMLLGWWAGASLGIRYFVGLTPLFAMSAAALFERVRARPAQIVLYASALACAAWTYLLFLGIHGNGVSALEYYPLDQQWANQWAALWDLPHLLAGHWQPLKSPLVAPLLLPFALVTYLALAFGHPLWRSPRLRSNRATFALALSPLLLSLLLVRAAQVGGDHLREAQARADYLALPRGIGDPLDLSSTYNERGRYAFRIGDSANADADFRRAQEIVPSNSYALLFGSDVAHIPDRLAWQFGRGVRLAGYSVPSVSIRAGDALWLALYWEVQSQPIAPYFVRLALVDADGSVVAASDDVPAQGQLAFRLWSPGVLLRDQYTLAVPPTTAAREYALRVRLFDKDTRQRLNLMDGAQETDGVLARIRVEPRDASR